jgi:hypothetical protein
MERTWTSKHSSYSIERTDGRKFDWIRKQLGLSKVELARQFGISRQSLYRCIWEGAPRLVALAILGLWSQDRIGGLLEEPSEPEEDMTRKPKGREFDESVNDYFGTWFGLHCLTEKD